MIRNILEALGYQGPRHLEPHFWFGKLGELSANLEGCLDFVDSEAVKEKVGATTQPVVRSIVLGFEIKQSVMCTNV